MSDAGARLRLWAWTSALRYNPRPMTRESSAPPTDFIRAIVAQDLESGKFDGRVVTRWPPEPTGYPHIGHAWAIWLNFEIAAENGSVCHLRMDDTNPLREEERFVQALQDGIRWLGYDWGEHLYYASDYFEQLYDHAVALVRKGAAYVCDLSADEIREHRGTLTEPGKDSPWRNRPVEENLDLFARMRVGEFETGTRTLRAKIDMASPNIVMRDPVLYRIAHEPHYRTGDAWPIYPIYDFAHCLSDSIERITHSLCTLEFENNRALYDWILDELELHHPQQIEFARLSLSHTLTSKRKLRTLVEGGHVAGWNDPRMPTIAGMRRRGYTPGSILNFCRLGGVSRRNSTSELALLEHCVREELNATAPRVMGVLRPLKLVIENYPEGEVEEFEAVNNPEDPDAGTRRVPFSHELYIERDDFREDPPRKYFRLAPGREVRLRSAYFVTCTSVKKNEGGEIEEVRCRYDPETRGGDAPDGRKVKATLHWVSAAHALFAEVRLYDTLFRERHPDQDDDYLAQLNPDSLETLTDCRIEPSLAGAEPGSRWQFERLGYFCVDPDSSPGSLVFNRTVTLRDTWARIQKQGRS